MKKKKSKQRIYELELQIEQEKSNKKVWKDIAMQFIEELKKYGVKAEIIPVEPKPIQVYITDDMKDIQEREEGENENTQPYTLSFDFTKHDNKIGCKTPCVVIEERIKYLKEKLGIDTE